MIKVLSKQTDEDQCCVVKVKIQHATNQGHLEVVYTEENGFDITEFLYDRDKNRTFKGGTVFLGLKDIQEITNMYNMDISLLE